MRLPVAVRLRADDGGANLADAENDGDDGESDNGDGEIDFEFIHGIFLGVARLTEGGPYWLLGWPPGIIPALARFET